MDVIPEEGINHFEADTHASPASLQAALTGIGGAVAAVDAVFSGKADNAFVAARPPGHHAEREKAMGFCFFNNAAIAARHAQKAHGAERVAIVDWDVHHGNGTQDIFLADPSVLFCSTHQMPLYPGTGAKDETGAGNIVNAPLSPDTGSDHFREAFRSRVLPRVADFRPDLIIISAGFDAHHRDPLAQINLVADDFDWATGKLMDLSEKSANNRVVSLLEGGYDLEGLAESAATHIFRLMRG
jgi:acetoin utilization deacetylase AcuC-like enzyme